MCKMSLMLIFSLGFSKADAEVIFILQEKCAL